MDRATCACPACKRERELEQELAAWKDIAEDARNGQNIVQGQLDALREAAQAVFDARFQADLDAAHVALAELLNSTSEPSPSENPHG